MKQFDVLIVGAGPAGSFAAELLARGGARVALFDGRPDGAPKPCGGGVTAKALKAWPQLLNAPARLVHELEMFSPRGNRLLVSLEDPLAIYSRVVLDSYLRDRARTAGAEVFAATIRTHGFARIEHGWKVQSQHGHEWFGKFLVGADGANSAIARALVSPLPKSEMGIAFGYRAPLPKGKQPATVLAFLPGWPGYAWAFPRLDHVSFGIAISQDDFEHVPLDQLLWALMNAYYEGLDGRPLFECNGSNHGVQHDQKHWFEPYAARLPQLSPEQWCSRPIGGEDWALLGDAAGFVDPITDEGIYFALRSAELFAAAFIKGDAGSYGSRCMMDFGRELSRAAKTRKRFYSVLGGAPFTERMIQLASKNRGVKTTLSDLISGRQQYVGLKRALLRNALRI